MLNYLITRKIRYESHTREGELGNVQRTNCFLVKNRDKETLYYNKVQLRLLSSYPSFKPFESAYRLMVTLVAMIHGAVITKLQT